MQTSGDAWMSWITVPRPFLPVRSLIITYASRTVRLQNSPKNTIFSTTGCPASNFVFSSKEIAYETCLPSNGVSIPLCEWRLDFDPAKHKPKLIRNRNTARNISATTVVQKMQQGKSSIEPSPLPRLRNYSQILCSNDRFNSFQKLQTFLRHSLLASSYAKL